MSSPTRSRVDLTEVGTPFEGEKDVIPAAPERSTRPRVGSSDRPTFNDSSLKGLYERVHGIVEGESDD